MEFDLIISDGTPRDKKLPHVPGPLEILSVYGLNVHWRIVFQLR